MAIRIHFASASLVTSMLFVMSVVWGAEPDDEMRRAARFIVDVEGVMAKRDLKGYCAATRGSPEYPGYVARACQAFVKNKMKKAGDCSDAHIKKEVASDIANCLAMPAADFDKEAAIQREGWERILGSMKAKGVDTDKLMKEVRAAQAVPADSASMEIDMDTRSTARMMVRIEAALEKRDLKAYCAVTAGASEYPGYVALACLERVERKLKKPEECSLANVKTEAMNDLHECLAMSAEKFEKLAKEQRSGLALWIAGLKKRSVDGEKLLREERAILR
ncbi:MAG: hypothetical protein K9J42_07585 [Sulfuritalea sp.]|nr:hypothetical protein [Sulfuritalea sp.]